MFLVFCEEDSSYLIVEETKAIFEDGVKKDDTIQFFHCNKMYTGCVIERSGLTQFIFDKFILHCLFAKHAI